MDKPHFWRLVKASRYASSGQCDWQVEEMTRLLISLPREEIIEFWNIYVELSDLVYRDDLYTAANIVTGSGSLDGFMDFGAWLIAQGHEVFEAALKDPDTLAAVTLAEGEDGQCEHFGYVALKAYKLLTGTDMPTPPNVPKDWIVDLLPDEEAQARMPNLWQKYMEEEDDDEA